MTMTARTARRFGVGSAIALVGAIALGACSGSSASVGPSVIPLVDEPTPILTPTAAAPTDLATEPGLTTTPKPTEPPVTLPASTEPPITPPPPPTEAPPAYYTPPGWDGFSDVDCGDFDTHAHAVSFFRGTGGSPSNDPYGLDRDQDGNPCETLP
jgi:hypothetical protein